MSTTNLLIVAAALVAMIFFLVVVVISQRRKLQDLQRPKYGFLGKPLTAVATLIMLGGLVGGVYLVSQPETTPLDANAGKNVTLNVEYKLVIDNQSTRVYEFSGIPVVDNVPYGSVGDETYSLFWNFTGTQNIGPDTRGLSEIGVSKTKPSLVKIELKPGVYTLRVLVVHEGKNYVHTQELVL